MTLVIPYVFASGNKAMAQEVNDNFTYLKNAIESKSDTLDLKIDSNVQTLSSAISQINGELDEIDSTMEEKAKTDFSNAQPNQTYKTTSINWVMPDYTKGVQKNWNTDYTAETDGWLYARGQNAPIANGGGIIKINEQSLLFGGVDAYSKPYTALFVPVAAGDTYRGEGSWANQVMYFYPCIGA